MATAAKKKSGVTAKTGEPQAFQAEVAKILKLMVHSVYSDRDVFLRELISNASDALDKLRYAAIAAPELLEGESALKISIVADATAKTLTLTDNGIGMTADELASNLGTIARSGTEAFMKDATDAPDLIGQFGVGFYAAFMVADRVEVTSRRAGQLQSHLWTSDGLGMFTVSTAATAPRGTAIVLHLKSDAADYLEAWKIEQVVRAYSDHIVHPILLQSADAEPRQINSGSAIWMRGKSEVTAEQHKDFHSSLSHGGEAPALTIHYRLHLVEIGDALGDGHERLPIIAKGCAHPEGINRICQQQHFNVARLVTFKLWTGGSLQGIFRRQVIDRRLVFFQSRHIVAQ